MKKIDVTKVISLTGTILGITASLLGSWSQQKTIDKTIEDKIKEALSNNQ